MKLSMTFHSVVAAVLLVSQTSAFPTAFSLTVEPESEQLFLCGEGSIPLSCDKDPETIEQKKAVVKVKRDDYNLKATIKCKGTAAAVACLSLDGEDGLVGLMVSNDGGVSMCNSKFAVGDQATEYKNVCKGETFKIDQKVTIERF